MQTYDCHACYVRGNEVKELTKNFKEAYGLLLARNNVLAESIAKLEKDIPWFFDRIAELEARYKAASGLALSWGNYFNRQLLEEEIDRMVSEEGEAK